MLESKGVCIPHACMVWQTTCFSRLDMRRGGLQERAQVVGGVLSVVFVCTVFIYTLRVPCNISKQQPIDRGQVPDHVSVGPLDTHDSFSSLVADSLTRCLDPQSPRHSCSSLSNSQRVSSMTCAIMARRWARSFPGGELRELRSPWKREDADVLRGLSISLRMLHPSPTLARRPNSKTLRRVSQPYALSAIVFSRHSPHD